MICKRTEGWPIRQRIRKQQDHECRRPPNPCPSPEPAFLRFVVHAVILAGKVSGPGSGFVCRAIIPVRHGSSIGAEKTPRPCEVFQFRQILALDVCRLVEVTETTVTVAAASDLEPLAPLPLLFGDCQSVRPGTTVPVRRENSFARLSANPDQRAESVPTPCGKTTVSYALLRASMRSASRYSEREALVYERRQRWAKARQAGAWLFAGSVCT